MSEFNFKSQICTSREQSERLLALGLKKETADMCWIAMSGGYYIYATPWSYHSRGKDIPAWSLHRLLDMAVESPHKYFTIFIPAAYNDIISHIEWLIKEGYFNKEYLEE